MRGMGWKIECNNRIIVVELFKLRPIMTAMSIKYQQLILSSGLRLSELVEHLFKSE